MTFWKIINIIIITSIILVVVFSENITAFLDSKREYLNQQESLNDFMHLIRLIINKWEGICMALGLSFLFLLKFILTGLGGLFNKITSK